LQRLLASRGDDTAGLTRMLLYLTRGSVAMLQGRHAEAASHFAAALELSLRRGVPRFWASQIGSVLPLLALHRPDTARELWGAVLAAGRRVIQLETAGLAAALGSLGPVEPRPISSQGALELAVAELNALTVALENPVRVAASTQTQEHTAPSSGCASGELVRGAGVWSVSWLDRRTHLPDLKGLTDLAMLLRQPNVEIHVLDLYAQPGGERRAAHDDTGGAEGSLGDAIDATAREAYRQQIRDLQEDVEDAEAMGDHERAERARTELESLIEHLASAYGLAGRPRQVGDPTERARSAVAWRLRNAVRRIAASDPVLGRHLTASVHTGTWCRYDPPEPVVWTIKM
jgi:hypothetical protein